MDHTDRQQSQHSILPAAGAIGLLLLLLLLIWNSAGSGLASLLSIYAARTSQLAPANSAVRLGSNDPDVHYVRATILEHSDLPAAIAEYYQAAHARPDDYVLWLSLARAYEMNGEIGAAINSARQAVPLAPNYAEPHYQLGNILLRVGQTAEAFRELRLAGSSNPTLMMGIIGLAWQISKGNVQFVTSAIQPDNPEAFRALGHYFRQRKEADAAIAMYTSAGSAAEEDRKSYIAELVTSKQFPEAAKLWLVGRREGLTSGVMIDPGFEQERDLNEPGFGWRRGEQDKTFRLSLDGNNPREGRSSLKVTFDGPSDPLMPVITQLVLVEARARYQLSFAVRSEGVVSGGPPKIAVLEGSTGLILGQSGNLTESGGIWRNYTIDFESGQSTNAVKISLQRASCANSFCPIFGKLWLDDFSLRKQ